MKATIHNFVAIQERLSLLERQMHLITELAASEFTILSLTEELEEAHINTKNFQQENTLLMAECGMLQDHVRCRHRCTKRLCSPHTVVREQGIGVQAGLMQAEEAWALKASTSRSAPAEVSSEACDLHSVAHSVEELEEGEIVEASSPGSAACAEDVRGSLPGWGGESSHHTLSTVGVTENQDTLNSLVPIEQELRGHLKSTTIR